MKDRIGAFLKAENKTAVQFAKEVGVQPSAISHILSGRNNPSLDFVLRMLEKYDFLSTDWLLFGKGEMYKVKISEPTLFDVSLYEVGEKKASEEVVDDDFDVDSSEEQTVVDENETTEKTLQKTKSDEFEKVICFYSDNTFSVYTKR